MKEGEGDRRIRAEPGDFTSAGTAQENNVVVVARGSAGVS